jgi:hypothetical protein
MVALAPAMLAAKPALAGAELRSRASVKPAAPAAKMVVAAAAEPKEVSRRSTLSLAAVRGARAWPPRHAARPRASRAVCPG